MVARTPPKLQRRMVAPLNPVLLRETLKKVDKCMARLQELQYTVTGGSKAISGVNLSPRSTRGYLRTSLRCKQESLRLKTAASKISPVGKLPATAIGEWRRVSLPAMLVGETVGEILQASQFARDIVAAAVTITTKTCNNIEDPKTPMSQQRKQRPHPENTELKSKRKKEKQIKLQSIRTEPNSPHLQRARSRINFKVSPPKKRGGEVEKESSSSTRYLANRVSPRNRPWAKKTVLFPNPLFLSADSTTQQPKFYRTNSPIIARTKKQTTPHKFLIKSPPSVSKFQVKIKNPPVVSISPTRQTNLSKKSPSKMSTAAKLRRSFSPSRLANRLVSPLKSRKSVQKNDGGGGLVSGLKQRPNATLVRRFSLGRNAG